MNKAVQHHRFGGSGGVKDIHPQRRTEILYTGTTRAKLGPVQTGMFDKL